jgi:hypothetical protein
MATIVAGAIGATEKAGLATFGQQYAAYLEGLDDIRKATLAKDGTGARGHQFAGRQRHRGVAGPDQMVILLDLDCLVATGERGTLAA